MIIENYPAEVTKKEWLTPDNEGNSPYYLVAYYNEGKKNFQENSS